MSKSESMTEVLHIENPLERDGTIPTRLPLVALRNTVLFPGAIMPITIGREKSKRAIEISYKADRWIGVITQRDMQVEDPSREDLYDVGVVAQILKVINLPDGNQAAMVQGVRRFRLKALEKESPYLVGSIELLPRSVPSAEDMRLKAMFQLVEEKAMQYIQEAPHIPSTISYSAPKSSSLFWKKSCSCCASKSKSSERRAEISRSNSATIS